VSTDIGLVCYVEPPPAQVMGTCPQNPLFKRTGIPIRLQLYTIGDGPMLQNNVLTSTESRISRFPLSSLNHEIRIDGYG